MAQNNNISNDLYDLLASRNFDVKITDESGNETTPENGSIFKFDYTSGTGKNYGTGIIILGGEDSTDMKFFYGDNLGRSMEEPDKTEWFQFLETLSDFATSHRYTWTPSDLSKLKYTMAGMAAIKEGLFEGYYGTRKTSYMGERTEARLVINHNRMLGENDKRYRYVESLFIETVDGERFKLPFTKLVGGRAMLEHVRQGGKPYDVRGTHIAETVQELNVLSRFNRASQSRMFEGVTQQLVEAAQQYYQGLQSNLKHMSTPRGYATYFEAWSPADIGEQEQLVEDLRTMFIEQTLDTRIEAALPTLAKIQQGSAMKEANQFESWANRLVEGTWALPETPEAKQKLSDLLANELPVGPDAANATEQLYDILGDDELFDRLIDLSNKDANADARPVIIARMREMGMEIPDTEPEPEINEGDNLATFECGTVAGGIATATEPMVESHMSEVDMIIQDVINGELDAYDILNHPKTPEEEYVANLMLQQYEEVARDRRLHPDDDFEQILDIVVDNLAKDYGHGADQGVAEGANRSDMVGFHLDSERAYNAVMSRFGDMIDHDEDSGIMYAPERIWPKIELVAFDADGIGAQRNDDLENPEHYGVAEDSTDPMDHRGAVTDSFYEGQLSRLKKLALGK